MIRKNGITKRLLPRTQYAFGNVGGNQGETVQLATHLEVYGFSAAAFILRLHPGTNVGVGAQLQFLVMADGHDFQDPSTPFLTQLASATVDSTVVYPFFTVLEVTGFGRYLEVQLVGTQPAAPVGLLAQVSLDVVLRGGDPTPYIPAGNALLGYENL